MGLPSRIRDEDCDIEPLSAADLESEAVSVSNEAIFGSCQPEHITYTIKMVEVARLREYSVFLCFELYILVLLPTSCSCFLLSSVQRSRAQD